MEKILDNDFYDLIISSSLVPTFDTGDNVTILNERLSLLHIPTGSLGGCSLGQYPYSNFPSIYALSSEISIERSGIGTVQNNPALGLFGKGVLVGIIDTGIDYRHPAFRNSDGSTRIYSIWDQTEQGGERPENFTFGSEYGRDLINTALESEDPLSVVPSSDTNGHGTAIASIAAGTPGEEQSFSGVAPEAELVIVKVKDAKKNLKNIYFIPENILCFQESDVLLAIRYLTAAAQRLNQPLAICIAFGTSQGGHDGRGAVSRYLDDLALLPGTGISVSAGNEGNKQRHYFNNTVSEPFSNNFELRVGNNDSLFSMEIWPYTPARLAIEISSPNRESTQLVFPSLNECRRFSFVFNETVILVNNIIFEEETGDQLILLRFSNALPGVWYLHVESIDNTAFSFHSWLPAGDFISDETFFLNSSPDTTVTSPGNTRHLLTVAAYNQINGSILAESGRGYSRTGQVKPDLAAPGYRITCALPDNQYGEITGTGAAAAHVAGIMAMLLEWAIVRENYIRMTGNDINRLLIRGAVRSSTSTYPNRIWGYGQVNINRLFEVLTNA
ncbi:S8 family peptidase [Lachnospiraceae bacterium 54-53]